MELSNKGGSVDAAIASMRQAFPFSDYVNIDEARAYTTITQAVRRHVPDDGRILDFGAGACDQTAILSQLGYQCVAVDDFQDPWHMEGDSRGRISRFAEEQGISVRTDLPPDYDFDLVTVLDVIEHLHESPRQLLMQLVQRLKPGGILLVSVPNAVNIRKRLDVARGRTNYPAYDTFFWWPGPWRGHVREYTKEDLTQLASYLDLEVLELRSYHHMLGRLPGWLRPPYRALSTVFKGWRDSWMLVARRPDQWRPSAKGDSVAERPSNRFG